MGCCFSSSSSKKQSEKKNKPTDQNASNDILINNITDIDLGKSLKNQDKIREKQNLIKRQREQFIDNFFSKDIQLNAIEKRNSIYITNLNKKMRISKDIITVEDDFGWK